MVTVILLTVSSLWYYNFKGAVSPPPQKKLYPRYYSHRAARYVAKFHEATPIGFTVLAADRLKFFS